MQWSADTAIRNSSDWCISNKLQPGSFAEPGSFSPRNEARGLDSCGSYKPSQCAELHLRKSRKSPKWVVSNLSLAPNSVFQPWHKARCLLEAVTDRLPKEVLFSRWQERTPSGTYKSYVKLARPYCEPKISELTDFNDRTTVTITKTRISPVFV